jgi:hypothetical protein
MKYLRIAVLMAGMIMLGAGAGLFAKNYIRSAETRNWPHAQARVTESRVETLHRQEVGNAGDFMPHVRYDYVVHGQTFHGDTLWLDERRSFGSANVAARELAFLETGTETEVMYNPQDPHEAALMVDKPTWRYFFLAMLGALFARLGWGFWRIQPRPRQPMPQPGMRPQPGMQMQPPGQAQPQLPPQFPAGGQLAGGPAPEPTS